VVRKRGKILGANASARTLSVEKSPVDAEAVGFSPAGVLLAAGRWMVSRKDASGWTDVTPRLSDADPAFASVFVDRQDMVWSVGREAERSIATTERSGFATNSRGPRL
jgi:hypothetical protein